MVSCVSLKLNHKNIKWDGLSSSKVILLSKADVESDINFLEYSLQKGYVGADFIDAHIWKTFIEEIKSLTNQKFVDNVAFCKKIGELFLTLPDSHFDVWFPKHKCYGSQKIKANVGPNYLLNDENKVFKVKNFSKNNTKLLAFKSFPDRDSVKWRGFEEAVNNLKKSKNIVVDLRGNGGGDSSKGLFLARSLLNSSIKHNRRKIIRKNSPEAWVIFRNGILRNKIWEEFQGRSVVYLNKHLNEIDLKIVEAVKNKEQFIVTTFPKLNTKELKFKGNIYVLIDKGCGSSCEHTLEALKFHPNTKTVGQNTSDQIHFGQMGIIRLPKSGIYIRLATQYFELFEEGNFEKKGYSPDIQVPVDHDALNFLFKEIL